MQTGKESEILRDDGLLGWRYQNHCYIGCRARHPVAVERLLRRKENASSFSEPIIWMSSLEQWKSFVPTLHPRVETLLFYHQRPLIVYCREWLGLPNLLADANGRMAIQLTPSSFIQYFASTTHPPVAVIRMVPETHGKGVDLDWADHWLPEEVQEWGSGKRKPKEVAITYTDSGELLFL